MMVTVVQQLQQAQNPADDSVHGQFWRSVSAPAFAMGQAATGLDPDHF